MDAEAFNELFDRVVAGPLSRIGARQAGRRIFFEDNELSAAVLRVETRNIPPPALLLVVRYDFMRDLAEEAAPCRRLANPSDYPVKVLPSRAGDLVDGTWRYEPHNLGRWPGEVVNRDSAARESLEQLSSALVAALPKLRTSLTPEVLLGELRQRGEDAHVERLWMEDLERATNSTA